MPHTEGQMGTLSLKRCCCNFGQTPYVTKRNKQAANSRYPVVALHHQDGTGGKPQADVLSWQFLDKCFFFFSSSLAVDALWHGPDNDISSEKSSTQRNWPVPVKKANHHIQQHNPNQDDPQIPQPDMRFVSKAAKQQDERGQAQQKTHTNDLPYDSVTRVTVSNSKHAKTCKELISRYKALQSNAPSSSVPDRTSIAIDTMATDSTETIVKINLPYITVK